MGSADESKPFILSDPLLPSTSSAACEDLSAAILGEEQQYQPITFYHGSRHLRDLFFLLFFFLLTLCTFALGIFASVRHNPNRSRVSSFIYDFSSSSCVPPSSTTVLSSIPLHSFSSLLLPDLIWTLFITLLLSGPIVLALLSLLRHLAKHFVYAAIPLFVLTSVFLNIYWFVACRLAATCSESFPLAYSIVVFVFVFVIIAIALWIIVANWHRIELTVRIVRIAAAALTSNIVLLAVLPAVSLCLVLYIAPIVVFLVLATFNGRIVPKEGKDGWCYCQWKQDGWVPAYFALAIITMLWSLAAMIEAQVYVTSGTIAQWYFTIDGGKPCRSIKSSLRNCFGPSFGTVCFSGMMMGTVHVVRAIIDSAKREDMASGFVNHLLQCCANVFFSAFDFVNKFTINFSAISGESYCSAAKMAYELLRRNLLSAAFVETVSTRTLAGIVLVTSSFYAIAVFAVLKSVNDLGTETYFIAALAWLLLILVLGYFIHVVENVIDTVYVCYAIDRDKGEVSMQEVHAVYMLLPLSRNHRPYLESTAPLLV